MEMIFVACLLTIVIELAFFLVLGYRDKSFIVICICANALTNLSLNLTVWLLYSWDISLKLLVYPLEAIAVATEFLIYGALKGRSLKLFLLTLSANLISYAVGVGLFGHV